MNEKRNKGAALIEFALVLPLLLAIIVGILYYGYAFVLVSAAQNAAKLGVESAVGVSPLKSPGYEAAVTKTAKNAAKNALDWLPKDTVIVSASIGSLPDPSPQPQDRGKSGSCQDIGDSSIVVQVVIKPNKGNHTILPVLSIGGYQIPPGLDSDSGGDGPAIKARACAQL